MVLPDDDLVEETIESVIDAYQHNPEYLAFMVEDLCGMFPHIDPGELEESLAVRLCGGTVSEQMITEADLYDALLMGDSHSSIDYLVELYPNLSRKEITKKLKSAAKAAKSSKRRTKKLTKEELKEALKIHAKSDASISKRKPSSRRTNEERIRSADVDEALVFYGFSFGPDLKDKIIKYMMKKYPTLGLQKVIDQLRGYDFGSEITMPGDRLPTPPRRGSSYQPIDFSPSSYGAVSSTALDSLRRKRSKYLPGYTSPPRSPMPPRGMTTPRRFRDDFPLPRSPPPRTPKSNRRLSFSRSRSSDYDA